MQWNIENIISETNELNFNIEWPMSWNAVKQINQTKFV